MFGNRNNKSVSLKLKELILANADGFTKKVHYL